jgi:Bacterial transcriptional activator domain
VRAGRGGGAGWQVLGQTVALWRGEPLADLGCEALRRALLPRLACQRLQAIEWRADAGLAPGRHGELLAVLTGLAGEYPLQERFCAQLMLALYRCGRQGEALAVYHEPGTGRRTGGMWETTATARGMGIRFQGTVADAALGGATPPTWSSNPSAWPG